MACSRGPSNGMNPLQWLRLFREAKVKDAPDADTSEAMLSGMHTEAIGESIVIKHYSVC